MKKFFNYMLYFTIFAFWVGLILLGLYFYFYPTIIFLLVSLIVFLSYHTYRMANIIMVFEDDLNDAIEAMKEAENSVQGVLEMKMFFDSDEIQKVVSEAMDSVRLAKFKLNGVINNFVDRSKQKYIMIVEDENENQPEGIPQEENHLIATNQNLTSELPPSPGSPAMNNRGGTVAYVEKNSNNIRGN